MSLDDVLGRYEYSDEKSNKFWVICRRGDGYEALWGRIGASPQSTSYEEHQVLKKIREKIAKGYVKVENEILIKAKEEMKEVSTFDFMKELRKI